MSATSHFCAAHHAACERGAGMWATIVYSENALRGTKYGNVMPVNGNDSTVAAL